ncbi:MAG: preprotein translocase subunit YajC [Bacteroidaceae bacterium]|jgi:preprotein translocase subunit YajC|nr:preprotein translocase subunit YajC [Bacteroidaceae bacterium]HAE24537.1 preprotein translocase subunit YajC [Prevotellaceae bacterium]
MTTLTIMLQAAAGGGSQWSFWIMILAVFAIMYFFMIRPQKKRQKEIEKFRNSLQVGDNVITSGGIHAVVKQIDPANNIVTVEIASGVKIQIEKSCIYSREGLSQQV